MRRRSSRGYTLAELLTVITLLAVLGALSMGAFMSLPGRFAHETAASSVRALLRRARAAAIESRADSQVVFGKDRVEARAWTTIALLRFEDVPMPVDPNAPAGAAPAGGPPTGSTGAAPAGPGKIARGKGAPDFVTLGARALEGRVFGANGGPGRLGNALYFESPGACVDLGDLPAFSARDGVRLEAFVMPGDFEQVREPAEGEVERKPRPPAPGLRHDDPYVFEIAGKGEAFFLRVREDYALVGGIKGAGARAAVLRETRPGALLPERWAEVALVYDGDDLRILVNGLRQDLPLPESERGARLPKSIAIDPAPLMISNPHPGLSFFGAIDEVRVLSIEAEEGFDVGTDLAIVAPEAVRFDARGELDALYHVEPVKITVSRVVSTGKTGLQSETRTAEIITVERSGALR